MVTAVIKGIALAIRIAAAEVVWVLPVADIVLCH